MLTLHSCIRVAHVLVTCRQVVKAFDCGPKVPGSNPTCCFTGEVLSLPLLPLGDQPLTERAWR